MSLPAPISMGTFYPDSGDPQEPADVGVVMTTILRPVIARAVRSVFNQNHAGRIQILIGVDVTGAFAEELDRLLTERPANVSALALTLPYSTSVRHGGVHETTDGGSLRSILSFMANSRYVAYLDDDNSWRSDHLHKLLQAVNGKAWAFAHRMLVHEETGEALGVDRWDSVGVDKGRFAAQGGFVDPNCLIIDKVSAVRTLGRWSETSDRRPGMTADRNFFRSIRQAPHGVVAEATVNYSVRSTNVLLRMMAEGREF